jgi:FlaA1/EpsC-like NDP-sugar epimerase
VEVIGVRPGEKKHEWLLHEQESIRAEYVESVWRLHQSGVYSEPFVLSSDKPAVWMDPGEMRRAIADAETV